MEIIMDILVDLVGEAVNSRFLPKPVRLFFQLLFSIIMLAIALLLIFVGAAGIADSAAVGIFLIVLGIMMIFISLVYFRRSMRINLR